MTTRKSATRPPKWVRPGAQVLMVGIATLKRPIASVSCEPFLEGDRWFVSLRRLPGFWDLKDLACGRCLGRGGVVHESHKRHEVTLKVMRCPQCRGVGSKDKKPLDLRDYVDLTGLASGASGGGERT